ncbi:MAG TPA: hypothetical protein VL053_13670 [Arachidicoccus sp.]|nr:hypothetical protein [Arachidicoccus sp.]
MKQILKIIIILAFLPVQFTFARSLEAGAGDTLVLSSKGGTYIGIMELELATLGDWKVEGFDLAMQKIAIAGVFSKIPTGLKPASIPVIVQKEGYFSLWVSSLDLPDNQPGTRFFYVRVNGKVIPKKFGVHHQKGFKWELAEKLLLKKGPQLIELIDSSAFYARTEGIYITPEQDLTSEIIAQRVQKLTASYIPAKLPDPIAASDKAVTVTGRTAQLKNSQLSIDFFELREPVTRTGAGAARSIIENEIKLKGKIVKSRRSSLALVLLKSQSGRMYYHEGFPIFQNRLLTPDGQLAYATSSNPYDAFNSAWLIPEKFEKVSPDIIKVSYQSKEISVDAFWELKPDFKEPKIRLVMKSKIAGTYSLIIPGYESFDDQQYSFALAPMRVTNKKVHPEPVVYTEQYLFTPMVSVTSSKRVGASIGSNVTTGYVIDPSMLEFKWTYKENNAFGMMLRDRNHKVSPAILAPFPGSPGTVFKAGQEQSIIYRPIFSTEGWYSSYQHVVKDIFKLRDYRQNYYSTLNDAIFETTKLMMDDNFGGWDSVGKAQWNMEGRSFTSNANPAQALQSYLLTEDDGMLTKRAIPTLANLLTRGGIHFKWNDLRGGANYFGSKTSLPRPIGRPINGYNASVFLGLFAASQGRTPYLKEIAQQKAKSPVVNTYGSIPPFINMVTSFKLTGDSSFFRKADSAARKYVRDVVYSKSLEPVDYSAFSYISYVPNLASIMDMYALTKDSFYLKAAEETGRLLLTQLWVPGLTPAYTPDSLLISADEIRSRPFNEGYDFFWHGDSVWRLGSRKGVKGPPENLSTLRDETVPTWVPSRVGLGLEQPSTFYSDSKNMIMSSWAGDLMKLSGLTGDTLFAIAARNAIIGRFSNYPGYYQNRFITIQQKPEYPYVGPDMSSIYWHHIAPFLAQLEDFLFAQAQVWSKQQVIFPSFRQQGYAYFNANQYGHKSGRFFNETDMWPWLRKDIVKTSNRQIDWLAARKDGVVGIAFMNESADPVKATVSLGAALGTAFTGNATLSNVDGTTKKVFVNAGKFDISIGSHALIGVTIKTDHVKKPAFANVNYASKMMPNTVSSTVADHGDGKGIILQIDPEKYFAYIYLTEMPDQLNAAVLNFKVGDGKWQQRRTTQYPFEFIIEVDAAKEPFEYYVELHNKRGSTQKTPNKILKPVNGK